MISDDPLAVTLWFHIGPVPVYEPVVTTWLIVLILAAGSLLVTRGMALRPGRGQAAVEILVDGIESQIAEIIPHDTKRYVPLIGTLFLFLTAANLIAVIPGLQPPTGSLATPAALAVIVFGAVHWYGIGKRGLRGHLASYVKPSPIMLPLNLLSEITRTFALMIRLFGNVMSGHFVVGIIVALAGLFVPIPFIALQILTGLIQAYIFTVLAAVFIGAAVEASTGERKNVE